MFVQTYLQTGLLLASAVAGFFAFRPLPSPAPQTAQTSTTPAAVQIDRAAVERDCPPQSPALVDEIEALQESLAERQEGYQAELLRAQAREGMPVPWPDDPPEGARPEVLRDAVLDAIEQLDDGTELVDMYCEELPCVAVLRSPVSTDDGTSHSYAADQILEILPDERFGKAYTTMGTNAGLSEDNQMVSVFALQPAGFTENEMFRLQFRVKIALFDTRADLRAEAGEP